MPRGCDERNEHVREEDQTEALGRITTHTAYHAGQLAMAVKYGG